MESKPFIKKYLLVVIVYYLKVVLRYCLPSLNTFLIVLLLDYHFHDWSEIQQWSPGLLVL